MLILCFLFSLVSLSFFAKGEKQKEDAAEREARDRENKSHQMRDAGEREARDRENESHQMRYAEKREAREKERVIR